MRFLRCTHSGKLKLGAPKARRTRGSGGMLPQTILKLRVSEMAFPTIHVTENAVISYLFHPSLEFSVTCNKKNGVKQW